MSIVSVIVNIVGGMGGPNNNAIPIYSDNKAPKGVQVYVANGMQLMLENSAVSGIQYIIVNPTLLSKEENANNTFVSFKPDGRPNYIRMWRRDPKTGLGDNYNGAPMWGEYSHLQSAEAPEPPTPPAGDESTFVVNWTNRTITLKLE